MSASKWKPVRESASDAAYAVSSQPPALLLNGVETNTLSARYTSTTAHLTAATSQLTNGILLTEIFFHRIPSAGITGKFIT